jgi:hypothetical protein
MDKPTLVTIIGAPIACQEGMTDSWREVAAWTEKQLAARFGEAVQVTYFDLLDVNCPPVPVAAQLPLVLVNGAVLSSGGKISVPAIRKRIEALNLGMQNQQELSNSP